MCAAFVEDPDVIIIISPQYVLCNYYPYPLKVFETEFASSEHAYQWRFLKHVGEDDIAREGLESSPPADAKKIQNKLDFNGTPTHLLDGYISANQILFIHSRVRSGSIIEFTWR